METLKRLALGQSTHTGVLLLAILLIGAKAAGVDVLGLTREAVEILTVVGGLSGLAKIALPEGPPAGGTPTPGPR